MLSFVLLAFVACNNDDEAAKPSNVAFAEKSVNLIGAATQIQIKFDAPAQDAGSLTVTFTETAVAYGTDFNTLPVATAKTILVPFGKGATSAAFTFNKVVDALEGQVKNVKFTITGSTANVVISGNNSIQVNFNETALLGNALAAEVGGPLQPNQVYVDLSSGIMTKALRSSWDLGFYSGTEFRVILNSSVKMSAKQLTTSNIDEVQVEDSSMIINQGSGSATQIDDPAGDVAKTTIAEVSATDANNKVYLIYLGNKTADANPALGKEGAASGAARGWRKVRVLRSGNDYKVQYANINATTHEEITITKSAAYNFTFLSLLDKKTVNVEPQKNQWDINFTTFTNIIPGATPTPYFYPDYVVSNLKGGAKAYQVLVSETVTYDNFALANVDNTKFTADQRNIGSNWRGTSATGADGNPVSQFVLRTDRFFVIKDPAGNVYKLKFTGGALVNLERGHPTFQYAILK